MGDLAKLNILFTLCILPTTLMFFGGPAIFGFEGFIFTFLLSLILAFPVGGALVAYVYYITKMMRDDPSYVWFEFKRKFLENYKQSALTGILCTAFIYTQIILWAEMIAGGAGGDIIWFLIALLSILIFGMITPYIFLHFAYVDLGAFRIIKNSVLMSFGYLPRSFMGALQGGLIWIAFVLFLPLSLIFLPVLAFFAVSVSILLCMMWIWSPFDKYFKVEETLTERMEETDEVKEDSDRKTENETSS